MARELYNWDQVMAYLIITVENVMDKNKEINIDIEEFILELELIKTLYKKQGIVGLAIRYLRNMKRK